MLLKTISEGLGVLLVEVCAVGICKGAASIVHLYDTKVLDRCIELGMTTKEKIRGNALYFKAVCIPGYLIYVLICICIINGTQTFWRCFWQCFP